MIASLNDYLKKYSWAEEERGCGAACLVRVCLIFI